jgi:hypothetical protein
MRIRVGVKHPLPFLKNAGIYARNLNAEDSERAKSIRDSFFQFATLLASLTDSFTVTSEGLNGPGKFGFIFTLKDE